MYKYLFESVYFSSLHLLLGQLVKNSFSPIHGSVSPREKKCWEPSCVLGLDKLVRVMAFVGIVWYALGFQRCLVMMVMIIIIIIVCTTQKNTIR